jgi:hypothetical protein
LLQVAVVVVAVAAAAVLVVIALLQDLLAVVHLLKALWAFPLKRLTQ